MIHHMKLRPAPFSLIACGYKTIELRLNDEKRQCIKNGDIIIFSNTKDPEQTVSTRVINIHRFADFAELYSVLPLDKCGYLPEELPTASPLDMQAYYDIEEQKRYGVLGIELTLLDVVSIMSKG